MTAGAATAQRWAEEEHHAEVDRDLDDLNREKKAQRIDGGGSAPDAAPAKLSAEAAARFAEMIWAVANRFGQAFGGPKYELTEEVQQEFVKVSIPVLQLYMPAMDGVDHPLVPFVLTVGAFYGAKYMEPTPPADETVEASARPTPVDP